MTALVYSQYKIAYFSNGITVEPGYSEQKVFPRLDLVLYGNGEHLYIPTSLKNKHRELPSSLDWHKLRLLSTSA